MRKIITYSTLGDNMKELYSAATNLGELQPDLTRAGIRFEGMKLMTNPGQVTLESLQAELPEGEFQLFIMPQKVKSGYCDDELVDECDIDGTIWQDEDWSEQDPDSGDFVFRSYKDLAIARSKRAFALLSKAIDTLAGTSNNPTNKPDQGKVPQRDHVLDSLRAEAAKLQNNMQMFD